MTETRAGVIFDVDGTLLDTNYLHVLAWWHAFRETGQRGIAMAAVHRTIGIGSAELVRRILDRPPQDLVDTAVEAHSRRFEALRDQVEAFPAAGDLLRACAGRGLRVVLATSGQKSDLEWMLPALGADDAIAGATTSADVPSAKPSPDLLQVAIEQHHLDPIRTAAVGDTVWDVESAERAGLPCIALLCGGIGAGELDSAGAAAVYEDPAHLLGALESSPIGAL